MTEYPPDQRLTDNQQCRDDDIPLDNVIEPRFSRICDVKITARPAVAQRIDVSRHEIRTISFAQKA